MTLYLSQVLWALLVAVVLMPFAITRVVFKRQVDLFAPVHVSSLTYLIFFVGPMAGSIFWKIDYTLFPGLDLYTGMIFTIIGLLSFYAGYYLPRQETVVPNVELFIKREQLHWSRGSLIAIVIVYCGFTIGSLLWFWFPLYGGLEGYLSVLSGFGVMDYSIQGLGYQKASLFLSAPAFYLAFLRVVRAERSNRSWTAWFLFIFTGVTSSVAMLLTGNRVFIIWNFIIPTIFWHYYKSRISVLQVAGGLFLAYVIIIIYTDVVRSPGSVSLSLSDFSTDMIFFYVNQTGEPHVVSDIINRQSSILGYQYGGTIIASLLNFIPRSFFPNKLATAGEIYTQYFYSLIWFRGVTYFGVPWVGELYMNGGPIGVILGMILTGILSRRIYKFFLERRTLIAGYTYAIAIFGLYFLIQRGSLQAISFPLLLLIPGLVAIFLISRTRKVQHTTKLRSKVIVNK